MFWCHIYVYTVQENRKAGFCVCYNTKLNTYKFFQLSSLDSLNCSLLSVTALFHVVMESVELRVCFGEK